MGAWGSSLYANDTTCDVRDTYLEFLQNELSNHEACEKIIENFGGRINDSDEAPLFWFALADTQWKVGRLTSEVKAKALEWIDKGGGMSLWEESASGGAGWKKTLDKLRAKLETEQPKEKRMRKPTKIESNVWNDGDVYAYLFHKEFDGRFGAPGKYMVLHKIGAQYMHYGDSGTTETYMVVRVFDRLFDALPALEDLRGIRLLPFDYPNRTQEQLEQMGLPKTQELQMQMGLTLYKKKDYPADYLTYMGNIPAPEYTQLPHGRLRAGMVQSSSSAWFNINDWSIYFRLWQGVEYQIGADGVYRYTHHE